MSFPMLNIPRMHQPFAAELETAVLEVVRSGYYINGPAVKSFEAKLAQYCRAKSAVGVSSGTDALLVAMMALGVQPGDEIITTPYTFFATAGCIRRLGAKPVFIDIQPDTFNIDPQRIESALTKKTKGIIPVHLFGQCCQVDLILDIAKQQDLWVLEDAAQSIGATFRGKQSGTMGTAGTFSFFPAKNLGALGDAGAVVTNDESLGERLAVFRHHGMKPTYYHHHVGGNFRLDAIQAAALEVKLPHLVTWVEGRQRVADIYTRAFADSEHVQAPIVATDCEHVYNQFVIRLPASAREKARELLKGEKIGHSVYYPVPLHLQACFADLQYKEGNFPESERAANESLALPVDPYLSEDQAQQVIELVLQAVN